MGNALKHAALPSTAYRPDIDGLRTIAVVPVVLFHAGLPFVGGGYVGVDVFFVISGFLITGIIARELAQGRFSLLEFYRRRARRIFPALTLVGFATLIAGYLILTPKEYADLGQSAAAIAAFISNFFFWKSVSYWAPGVQPMLHTWSLAVEEQYYVFFPLFLMLMHGRRRWMIIGLWAVFAASLALSIALVASRPSAAFYLLPPRAWELMLGGLLALDCFGQPRSPAMGKAASVAGLALILGSVLLYTPATPFPGAAALPPVLGAGLLIWGGGWGLSARPLVAIGLISYSLYLWHLPVIDFARYLTDAPLTAAQGLLATLLSVVLAALTYRYVETPFRTGKARQKLTMLAAVTMPVMALAGFAIFALAGIPARLSPLQARQLAVVDDQDRHPSRCMSLDERWIDPATPCQFGAHPTTLLWGDSHSMVTATSLQAAGVPFYFAADADCPIGQDLAISPDFERALTQQGHYRRCWDYNRAMLARALQPGIRTVVLSARWTNWRLGEPANPAEGSVDIRLVDAAGTATSPAENRVKFEAAFRNLVATLTAAGKRVVIVGPYPEPTFNVPHRMYVAGFGLAQPIDQNASYAQRHRVILDFFRQFAATPGVTFVWPASMMCKPACPVSRDDVPLYLDHNHLTVAEARRLAPLYRFLRPT
ncbi:MULTISPECIES: acyltransferase family protein [Sphingomonas]|uniref:acyltransferase family protein n=1 Tax=Sphingomonas TaxID=13687 RepID=UPI0013B3B143|nr:MULTISPECIES: acyltransferase family protein [Sphingomonas]